MTREFLFLDITGYVPADPDFVEDSNTNRLVGSTLEDVAAQTPKVDIATRAIRGLMPEARIQPIAGSWKENLPALRCCDVILGAVDSFSEREQLERFARRLLIPYIDIGMDVHDLQDHGYLISGQVFLSMPGFPCLRCCNIITDERLRREAERYGAAGSHPQVVWPNGIHASTAMGLAIQRITPWYPSPRAFAYLEYDGNRGTVVESRYMRQRWMQPCPHHPLHETGDPLFDIRSL